MLGLGIRVRVLDWGQGQASGQVQVRVWVCIRIRAGVMFSATVWVRDYCHSILFPINCFLTIFGEVGGYWAPFCLNFQN